jgi:NitT/TauT family transport system substrate-binding protein
MNGYLKGLYMTRGKFCRMTAGLMSTGLVGIPRPLIAQTTLTEIHIGGNASDSYKTAFYAQRAGIFRRYGLNADVTIIQNGAAGLAAMAGGTLQFVFASLLQVIQAHARGVNFQIVAPGQPYDTEAPTVALLVKTNSAIKSAADLNGKTIASPSLHDLYSTATFAWIDQNGGDSKTVRAVELPASATLAALDDGKIAAVTTTVPFLDAAVASGRVRVLAKSFDAIGKHFLASAYVASQDFIEKNPDVVTRFARAIHESIVYTNAHLPETVDLVASFSGVAPEIVAKTTRATASEYLDSRLVQPLVDVSAKYGLIGRGFPASEIISERSLRAPRA